MADFRETPEACMLINYRTRETKFTFEDRMSVTRCIEKVFAPVFLEMRVESPSLSESDLIYCALIAAGFKPEVIADCISISKESLRMRKIRVKEKLSSFWTGILFPESDATKSCDNVAQHNSQADEATILLRQNQLNSKVMETKKITFSSAVISGWRNCFNYSGRASRKEFWVFFTFNTCLFIIVALLAPRLLDSLNLKPLALHRTIATVIYLLAIGVLLPIASLIIRRLHDSEKNGWLSLMVLIPVLGLAISPLVYVITQLPMAAMAGANSIMGSLLIPGTGAIIALCSLKGTEGPNSYGPDPKVKQD